MTDQPTEAERDFLRWCEERRLLGRDRLWPAFEAGWALGFASAVDQLQDNDSEAQIAP
jgi:hypothetical protein